VIGPLASSPVTQIGFVVADLEDALVHLFVDLPDVDRDERPRPVPVPDAQRVVLRDAGYRV
jgi:hypothetical protein